MSLATLHNLVANLGAAAQIARQLRSSESLRSAPDDRMRVADLLMAIAEARSEATTLLLSSVPATAHSAPSPVTPIEWSAHDLRRTFVTLATRLEEPDRMVKRLVNHTERDVTGMHYIRLSVDTLRPYTQRIEDELFRLWNGSNEQPN